MAPSNDPPRILIVEDGYLVAMEMKSAVERCGGAVVGPLASVRSALEAARQTTLDGAVLDVNLGDERVWPVAEFLKQQGVPFVFATGYSAAEVPPRFKETPVLAKPVALDALRRALAEMGLIGR